MFSDMLKRLRAEAEKVSPTNADLLWAYGKFSADDREFWAEQSRRNLAIGLTGLVAIHTAPYAANLVSALADRLPATMANVSASLNALSATAVEGAALPVSALVALGFAVAGAADLIFGEGLREERDFRRYLDLEQRAADNPDGRCPTTMNWLEGATNLVVQGVRDFVRGRQSNTQALKMDPHDFMDAIAEDPIGIDHSQPAYPRMR